MTTRFIIAFLLLSAAAAGGEKDGRRGNALYAEEQYAEAADAYRAGLAALGEGARGSAASGLWNNLGSALYRQGQLDEAQQAFAQSLAAAESDPTFARAAYNAGNTAVAQQNLDAALEHYQRALLANPNDEAAKFNYEFVKRKQEQQQQGDGEQNDEQDDENQEQNEDGQNEQGDDEQQEQEQQGEQQEDEQDQGQQQDQQNQQPQDQQGEQQPNQQQPQPSANELSREQALRILQALENDEEQLLREVKKPDAYGRRVEKDW